MTVTESRLAVLKDILNQFGIERNGDELTLTSDTADFADAKNRFLQAIIKVGDMSMLANPMCRRILQMTFVCSLMRTTYGMWKTFNSVASLVCCARMTLCCRSRVNSRNDSAHLLRGLPSDSFPVPYFSWEDTQAARKTPSELVVVFLNDSDRRIDNQLITALEKYNAYPIKWSEREFKENLYKLAS